MSELPPEVPDFIRSAIIIDPRDIWGNLVSAGLGDVIAALTPTHRLDKRGEVTFWDSFEDGLNHFTTTAGGTGAEVSLISDEARFGPFAVKLTGGSDGDQRALITAYLGFYMPSRMGLEANFRIGTTIDRINVTLTLKDGTKRHNAGVRYDYATGKWQYRNSVGVYTDLLTLDNALGTGVISHPVKMVVDFTTDLYTRLLLSGQEVDMSTLACEAYTEASTPAVEASIAVYSRAGNNDWCYTDLVILTQNEPA